MSATTSFCHRCGDDSSVTVADEAIMCFDCYDFSGQSTLEEFVAGLARWKKPPTCDAIGHVHAACMKLVEERARQLFGGDERLKQERT